jgi:hypothetical protein
VTSFPSPLTPWRQRRAKLKKTRKLTSLPFTPPSINFQDQEDPLASICTVYFQRRRSRCRDASPHVHVSPHHTLPGIFPGLYVPFTSTLRASQITRRPYSRSCLSPLPTTRNSPWSLYVCFTTPKGVPIAGTS